MLKWLLMLGFIPNAFAGMKHVHGVGELYLGVSGKKLATIMTIPAESIIGFEYEPKTKKDIETEAQKIKAFEQVFFDLVQVEVGFGCKMEKASSQIKREHNHGEYTLTASAICQKDIVGTVLKLDFAKNYPSIKKLNVNVVTEKGSQSLGLLKGKGEITLP